MQEGCSGDAARRAGNEYLFQMLAETNLETFEEIGVKKIVASCPHCFHTLGKEYKEYGGEDIEVMHHSQLINHLQQEEKCLNRHDGSVTFHDPCYLGRIGGDRCAMQLEELMLNLAAPVTIPSAVVQVEHKCGWKRLLTRVTIE